MEFGSYMTPGILVYYLSNIVCVCVWGVVLTLISRTNQIVFLSNQLNLYSVTNSMFINLCILSSVHVSVVSSSPQMEPGHFLFMPLIS